MALIILKRRQRLVVRASGSLSALRKDIQGLDVAGMIGSPANCLVVIKTLDRSIVGKNLFPAISAILKRGCCQIMKSTGVSGGRKVVQVNAVVDKAFYSTYRYVATRALGRSMLGEAMLCAAWEILKRRR